MSKGRGLAEGPMEMAQKEKGPRCARCADHGADWWNRTANALNTLEQLKKRNRGKDMQDRAART
eukprot:3382995-Pyramimonas_sp.AAC.1